MALVNPTYRVGKSLSFKIDGTAYHNADWKFTPKVGTVDMTNGQTSGYGFPEGAVLDSEGTATIFWPVAAVPAIAITPGTIYPIELIVSGSVKYSFNGLIVSCPTDISARGGLQTVITFMSQGAITFPA